VPPWRSPGLRLAGAAASDLPEARGLARQLAAADAVAVRWSSRVGRVLLILLPANAALAALGVALGTWLRDDPALYFRELMPGTLVSAAHLVAAALVARSIHLREPSRRRWHDSFWGLSAALLLLLAVVELTQPTVFLSHWLGNDVGLREPSGFADIDAVLMVVLLGAVALVLLRRVLDVLRHPRALVLFACTAFLGALSQAIDATHDVSTWEFVVEDGLKAMTGPFLLAAYLAALAAFCRSGLCSD
jgi:hypothetical protein